MHFPTGGDVITADTLTGVFDQWILGDRHYSLGWKANEVFVTITKLLRAWHPCAATRYPCLQSSRSLRGLRIRR